MSQSTQPAQKGARLIVSFELADVRKQEGTYIPELTVAELLTAIEDYTRDGCRRTGTYDEEISSPFLLAVDFAVATAARKAVLALFAQLEADKKALEAKNSELEARLGTVRMPSSPPAGSPGEALDDDIPF